MRETPLYQGTQYKEADRPQAALPRLSLPENPFTRALPQAVEAAEQALDRYAGLKDYQQDLEKARERKLIESDFKTELRRRAELPWGSDESVYNADGRINRDAVQTLLVQYQDKVLATRGNFWKRQNNIRDDAAVKSANAFLEVDAFEMLGAQERQNLQRSAQDTFALMEEQGDIGGAFATADSMVQNGLITPQRAELMKLRIAKRGLSARASQGGSVRIGGKEYTGEDAAFAAAAARAGMTFEEKPQRTPDVSGDLTMQMPQDDETKKPLTMQEPEAIAPASGSGSITEMALAQPYEASTLTMPAESWANGHDDGVIKAYTASEFSAFSEALQPPVLIETTAKENGTMAFSCPSYASDGMQRLVSLANVDGELSEDAMTGCIFSIAADFAARNPKATADGITGIFDGSGFYERMGDGNPELGKGDVQAIVSMAVRGVRGDNTKLKNEQVSNMVNATLQEQESLFSAKTWKKMEKLDPGLEEGATYKKPKEAKALKRWTDLEAAYKAERHLFTPDWAETHEYTKEEFERNAQPFYNWYMGGSKRYEHSRTQTLQAARAWYMGQIGLERARQTKGYDKKTGNAVLQEYANDVELVKAVLAQPLPDKLGDEQFAAQLAETEKEKERLAGKLREDAAKERAKLNAHREAFNKQKERAEETKKQEKKDAELAQKNAQKEAERKQRAAYVMERQRVRSSPWEWMPEYGGDGAVAACKVPQSMLDEMTSGMGFDVDTMLPFIMLGRTKVPVVGISSGDKVQLNTKAAKLAQTKPKKGESYRVNGQLSYSVYFQKADKL